MESFALSTLYSTANGQKSKGGNVNKSRWGRADGKSRGFAGSSGKSAAESGSILGKGLLLAAAAGRQSRSGAAPLLFGPGQGKEEGVARVIGLGPDLAVVEFGQLGGDGQPQACLLYTSPSPRDRQKSRMPSSA